ncbi:MAG: hypothetical protein HYX36_09500 [Rhizobiales bacterium]|nr:hypothetical protein [Hyphomicrobiales bacterium]
MKRLTFDTESNYFMPPGSGIGSVDAHRDYWRGKNLRFDCGVVFEEETGKYREFDDKQTFDLLALLTTAAELVSHSGPRVDLIVLEHACGEDRVAPLHRIKHHDLMEIHNMVSLDDLSKDYIGPFDFRVMETRYRQRIGALDAECKRVNWSDHANFIATKMAKARYDVERTYAVFRSVSGR